MSATLDVISIGRLACDVQASVSRVRQALEHLGLTATIRINGVDHFPADTADRLYPVLSAPEFTHSQEN